MQKIFLVLVTFIMSAYAFAAEQSLYNFSWLDNDKEIYVLQNRKFRKDGSFYVGATGAYNLSQDFLDAYGGTARAGFFFSEDWGIEGVYGKNTSTESDTAKGVKEQGAIPFYREIDSYVGAMVMWSPFYSKINTFNKVFYYDWMFGLGAASITTKDNRKLFDTTPGINQKAKTSENTMGALWNTGLRVYITESWSLRLDITGLTYSADKTKRQGSSSSTTASKVFTNYDLGVGLNYAF
jgi:outer membrane beta-barrel protein